MEHVIRQVDTVNRRPEPQPPAGLVKDPRRLAHMGSPFEDVLRPQTTYSSTHEHQLVEGKRMDAHHRHQPPQDKVGQDPFIDFKLTAVGIDQRLAIDTGRAATVPTCQPADLASKGGRHTHAIRPSNRFLSSSPA